MAEHHESSGNKTTSSGSANEGRVMKIFKEVVNGGAETVSEASTSNMVKFLDSAAKDFPPGISGGGGGSGGHN